jgi:hypothetical protein
MRPYILILALAAALAATSAALAKNGPDPIERGKAPAPAAACRSRVALILRGTFVAAGEASFRMIVRRAYGHGGRLRGQRDVSVTARTTYRRNGARVTLSALRANDRLLVYARGCKRKRAPLQLVATNVFAHGRAAPKGRKQGA